MNRFQETVGLATIPNELFISSKNSSGKCITNVDGICVTGGTIWNKDPLNGNPGSCSTTATPLFCSVALPYTTISQGYQCSTNANLLKREITDW